MSNKQDLRTGLLAARNAMPAKHRDRMNRVLCASVLAWSRANLPPVLALYMPMRGEPDLLQATPALVAMGTTLALPVVVQRDAPLAFAAWSPEMPMTRDLARVAVPAPPQKFVEPDALLIPCLGYNRDGYRLGYGAGYYDRTLAERPGIRAIGIAWSASQVEFEPDACDVPMDLIITDAGTLTR